MSTTSYRALNLNYKLQSVKPRVTRGSVQTECRMSNNYTLQSVKPELQATER